MAKVACDRIEAGRRSIELGARVVTEGMKATPRHSGTSGELTEAPARLLIPKTEQPAGLRIQGVEFIDEGLGQQHSPLPSTRTMLKRETSGFTWPSAMGWKKAQ